MERRTSSGSIWPTRLPNSIRRGSLACQSHSVFMIKSMASADSSCWVRCIRRISALMRDIFVISAWTAMVDGQQLVALPFSSWLAQDLLSLISEPWSTSTSANCCYGTSVRIWLKRRDNQVRTGTSFSNADSSVLAMYPSVDESQLPSTSLSELGSVIHPRGFNLP